MSVEPHVVQHGGDADARAEMLGVGGDGDQGLGGGPEQEVVDGFISCSLRILHNVP